MFHHSLTSTMTSQLLGIHNGRVRVWVYLFLFVYVYENQRAEVVAELTRPPKCAEVQVPGQFSRSFIHNICSFLVA